MATSRDPLYTGTHTGGIARWGGVDWGAILASVFAGLGITLLLTAIGAAIGVTVSDDDDAAGKIATTVGIWALISTAVGTFLGAYIGGAMMRWGTRFSSLYHGVAAWSFTLILSIWLGVNAAAGLVGASLQAANAAAEANTVRGDDVQNVQVPQANLQQVLESGSWWLVAGLIVSLALAVAGWFLGAKTSPVDETPAEVRA